MMLLSRPAPIAWIDPGFPFFPSIYCSTHLVRGVNAANAVLVFYLPGEQ